MTVSLPIFVIQYVYFLRVTTFIKEVASTSFSLKFPSEGAEIVLECIM